MSAYLEPIKIAAILFPFIAAIISVPFILVQYHKFGSISFMKCMVLYSFVLYLLCAYFLVILPLPSMSHVAQLTTPRTQLIPFEFVRDFIRETPLILSQPSSYLRALKSISFIVPAYNVLLTLPLGIYLRYYFKTSLKKTVLLSFLLSLFFELTQLTGLYFIYPRSYRLFDVDDLILNTLGGLLGYLCAPVAMKILPSRREIDEKSLIRGRKVSGLRRTTALLLDIFIYSLTALVLSFPLQHLGVSNTAIVVISFIIYYVAVPLVFHGATLGERFLNLRITDGMGKYSLVRYMLRVSIFVAAYIGIPMLLLMLAQFTKSLAINETFRACVMFMILILLVIYYICIGVKYLFTNHTMVYEKLSKTKMVSTIEVKLTCSEKKESEPSQVNSCSVSSAKAKSL